MFKYTTLSLLFAGVTTIGGVCERGYLAMSAEIWIMLIPVVMGAISMEQNREVMRRRYQDWKTVKESERRQYLGEIKLRNILRWG